MKKNDTEHNDGNSNADPELVEEITGLLEQVLLAEATNSVWEKFEKSLSEFDESSLSIFEKYLDGVPIETLSKENNVTEEKIVDWIAQLKRDLIQQLKKEFHVRH